MWGSHSSVAEDTSLLGCDTVNGQIVCMSKGTTFFKCGELLAQHTASRPIRLESQKLLLSLPKELRTYTKPWLCSKVILLSLPKELGTYTKPWLCSMVMHVLARNAVSSRTATVTTTTRLVSLFNRCLCWLWELICMAVAPSKPHVRNTSTVAATQHWNKRFYCYTLQASKQLVSR